MTQPQFFSSSQRGSAEGLIIWMVVGILRFAALKATFFPGVNGKSPTQLIAKFGEPVAKTVIPRPR